MSSVKEVCSSAGVPVDFEELFVSEIQSGQSCGIETIVASCQKNKVCLKGIISSPQNFEGGLLQTLNMKIINDLFARLSHVLIHTVQK